MVYSKRSNDLMENVVFSYVNVLENYYTLATLNVTNPSMSFEEYFDGYYDEKNELKLFEYTVSFAINNGVNEEDAKEWSNLEDVIGVNIAANSSVNVQISENWFAGHIATSYIASSYRIITYANDLNANSKTLSQFNNFLNQ